MPLFINGKNWVIFTDLKLIKMTLRPGLKKTDKEALLFSDYQIWFLTELFNQMSDSF